MKNLSALYKRSLALIILLPAFSCFGANKLLDDLENRSPSISAETRISKSDGLKLLPDSQLSEKEKFEQALDWVALEPWLNAWYSHLKVSIEMLQNASEPDQFNVTEKTLNAHRIVQLQYQAEYRGGRLPPSLRPFAQAFDQFLKVAPSFANAYRKKFDEASPRLEALRDDMKVSGGFDDEAKTKAQMRVADYFDQLLFSGGVPNVIRQEFYRRAGLTPKAELILQRMKIRRLLLFLPDEVIAKWQRENVLSRTGDLYMEAWFLNNRRVQFSGEHEARDLAVLPHGWTYIDGKGKIVTDAESDHFEQWLSSELSESELEFTSVEIQEESLLFRAISGEIVDHQGRRVGTKPKQVADIQPFGYVVLSEDGSISIQVTDESHSILRDDFDAWNFELEQSFTKFHSIASCSTGLILVDCKGSPHAFSLESRELRQPVRSNSEEEITPSLKELTIKSMDESAISFEYDFLDIGERVTWVQSGHHFSRIPFTIMEGSTYSFFPRARKVGHEGPILDISGYQSKYGFRITKKDYSHQSRWPNTGGVVGLNKEEKEVVREMSDAVDDFHLVHHQWAKPNSIMDIYRFFYDDAVGPEGETLFTKAGAIIQRIDSSAWKIQMERAKKKLAEERAKNPNYNRR